MGLGSFISKTFGGVGNLVGDIFFGGIVGVSGGLLCLARSINSLVDEAKKANATLTEIKGTLNQISGKIDAVIRIGQAILDNLKTIGNGIWAINKNLEIVISQLEQMPEVIQNMLTSESIKQSLISLMTIMQDYEEEITTIQSRLLKYNDNNDITSIEILYYKQSLALISTKLKEVINNIIERQPNLYGYCLATPAMSMWYQNIKYRNLMDQNVIQIKELSLWTKYQKLVDLVNREFEQKIESNIGKFGGVDFDCIPYGIFGLGTDRKWVRLRIINNSGLYLIQESDGDFKKLVAVEELDSYIVNAKSSSFFTQAFENASSEYSSIIILIGDYSKDDPITISSIRMLEYKSNTFSNKINVGLDFFSPKPVKILDEHGKPIKLTVGAASPINWIERNLEQIFSYNYLKCIQNNINADVAQIFS